MGALIFRLFLIILSSCLAKLILILWPGLFAMTLQHSRNPHSSFITSVGVTVIKDEQIQWTLNLSRWRQIDADLALGVGIYPAVIPLLKGMYLALEFRGGLGLSTRVVVKIASSRQRRVDIADCPPIHLVVTGVQVLPRHIETEGLIGLNIHVFALSVQSVHK